MIALMLVMAQAAAGPDAAEIMAKVAANQERAQQARSEFVYQQNLLIRFRRGNRKLAREERREYLVAPTPNGADKTLTKFSGKYEQKGKVVEYDKAHYKYKDLDIDGDVISDLADDMANDSGSRDGVGADLFPLTGREQKKYSFQLKGTEAYRGREVYRVEFSPTGEDSFWAGTVLVDRLELQPVSITTRMGRRIPFWVKTFFGTDLKYLGFSLAYERFDDGIWFPVSYGGEFEVRAVFFYKRFISISLANSGFKRTDVNSQIKFADIP
jgi:hypothetical protein